MKRKLFFSRKAKEDRSDPKKQEIVDTDQIESTEPMGTIERIGSTRSVVKVEKIESIEDIPVAEEEPATIKNDIIFSDDSEEETQNVEEEQLMLLEAKAARKAEKNAAREAAREAAKAAAAVKKAEKKAEKDSEKLAKKAAKKTEKSAVNQSEKAAEKAGEKQITTVASTTKREKKIKNKEKFNLGRTLKANWRSVAFVVVLLVVAFFMGRGIAIQREKIMGTSGTAQKSTDWGLGFGAEGSQPTGNSTPDEMKKNDAYYVGNNNDKVIYLTFDCGYENGNTPAILEALKKHNAPATFFVVGNFLTDNPDLVKQMIAEGHTVGNHTMHHRDVSKMGKDEFQKEIKDVEDKYKEITGQDMVKYYRAPQGKYTTENLKMAKDMGYKTIFWSLAYVDWNVDKQPSKDEAFNKLIPRTHSGAVVLLHNTSKTNGQILDELLTKWEEMGYRFEPVNKLWDQSGCDTQQNTDQNNDQNTNQNMDQQEDQTVAPDTKDTPSAETNAVIQEI